MQSEYPSHQKIGPQDSINTRSTQQPDIKEREVATIQTSTHPAHVEHDQQCKQLIAAQNFQENSCLSYGKNIVLLRTKNFTLFLGPDYLFFIPTFIVFVIVSYLLINYIGRTVDNVWAGTMTKIICIGECLSYLLVVFSDPGIAKPVRQENKDGVVRTKFCSKCKFSVPRKAFHCSYCDVCIEGYDHHCPWTSKCIGRNNLFRFYFFLFMTPVFIVYCAFAYGFAGAMSQAGQNLRKVEIHT